MIFKRILFFAFFCSVPFLIYSCSLFKSEEPPAEDQISQPGAVSEIEIEKLETRMEKQAHHIQLNQKKINEQQSTIAALEKKVQQLEQKKSGRLDPKLAREKYNTPELLYKNARNYLLEDNYLQAAGLFSAFLNEYPDHNLADNAIYWLGECHYAQGDFQQAIFVFKDLVKKYPDSQKVPDALLKTGYSYLSLNDTNRASHFLKRVIKRYPFSEASDKAQKKLKETE